MLDRNLDNLFIDENLNADFFKSFSEKNIESLLKFCIKLRHEKKSLKAIDVLLLAQQKFPENIFILNTLANCYQECDQDDQAIVYYLMAIKINSSSPEIFHNLGNSYYKIKNYGKAIKSYEQAISINPRLAKSLQFLGNCFYNLGEVELAHDYYLKSLAIDDQQASPWIDYGVCCMALNLTDQAIINFEKALSISPTNNIARFNLGLCQLKVKKFIPGWFNYEARWETPSFSIYKREFQAPVWNGHYSLTNKTILIYAEQGFGDTIQFCRYIKNLKELGAKVIFEVQEPLMKLLGQLNVDHIIKYGDAHLYVFDYQCPLLSLPLALSINHISQCDTPYLKSIYDASYKILNKAPKDEKLNIGIAWSGNPNYHLDKFRPMKFDQISEIIEPNHNFHIIQKQLSEEDKKAIATYKNVYFYGNQLNDFSDTANLIDGLDLIITTCTSVAHLSGALGKETWVLLPYSADWRWFDNGQHSSSWYPNLHLFRQNQINDWSGAIDLIKKNLNFYTNNKHHS